MERKILEPMPFVLITIETPLLSVASPEVHQSWIDGTPARQLYS
jgi:hypothetical protein